MRCLLYLMLTCLSAGGAGIASAQTPASPSPAGSQISGHAAPQPTTQPPDVLEIINPTVLPEQHEVTLPAAFWNMHEADWIEVALCGRPSDFLHETVLAVTTTRHKLISAMHIAGFHDADAWTSHAADFPQIRGDTALLLVTLTRNGHPETYLLDELISYQDWQTSIGPYGWMFKGSPQGNPARLGVSSATTTSPAEAATLPTTAPLDNPRAMLSVGQQIVSDDPQAALVFQGLRHASQSFLDCPLAYQQWLYPDMSFSRNTGVLPMTAYNSNGKIALTLTLRKVNTLELLQAAARYWHDPGMIPVIQAQFPRAKRIDDHKQQLWALLPKLAAQMEQQYAAGWSALDTPEAHQASLLSAEIHADYAALDAAWTDYAAAHAKFSATEEAQQEALSTQRDLWRNHMDLTARSAAASAQAAAATAQERTLTQQAATRPADLELHHSLQQAQAAEIAARAQAIGLDAQEPLAYWNSELAKLDPTDPRATYRHEVQTHIELAQATSAVSKAGAQLAYAVQINDRAALDAAQSVYQTALLKAGVAQMKVNLIDLNFEIAKQQSLDHPDADLPALLEQRTQMIATIKAAQAGLTAPATQPAAETQRADK